MNKKIFSILAATMLMMLSGSAGSAKKIVNPSFKSRTSSVLTIEEMDLGKKETKVKFRAIFRPGYWFKISESEYLFDPETGKKFYPTDGEGVSLGERLVMPESGDTTFTLTYPPIPKNTKILDFSPNSVFHTFGISLSDKNSSIGSHEDLLTEAPRNPTPSFFKGGDVRIHGKLKGYDPRLGFDSFQVFIKDIPIDKQVRSLLPLDSAGNFDKTFSISSPLASSIVIPFGNYIHIYLEPDNDIEIMLDWEDLLDFDRKKGLKKKLEHVQFGGSLAAMSRMLDNAPEMKFIRSSQLADTKTPEEAKRIITEAVADYRLKLNKYADEIKADPYMRKYLNEMVQAEEAFKLLDYETYRDMKRREFPDSAFFKDPLTKDFYMDFMPQLLQADTTILATSYGEVILNRLAFSSFPKLFELNRYNNPKEVSEVMKEFASTEEVPFLWQIANANSEGNAVSSQAKWYPENFRKDLDNLYSHTIKSPYLQKRLNDLFEETVNAKVYDLPSTPGGDIMRKLVEPYAGKWVFVDFWATTCGPCRGNIQGMKKFRDLNRDNDRFTFLFITGADESSRRDYNDYVEKHLQGENSVILDTRDMVKVRDLFGISAIPRYIVIDPEGRVADSDFDIEKISRFLENEKIPFKAAEW